MITSVITEAINLAISSDPSELPGKTKSRQALCVRHSVMPNEKIK